MQLTKNFTREEFACNCGCGFDQADPALVYGLQRLRDALKRPVVILSGCRCAAHNRAVGGAPGSQHLLGTAADIHVKGLDAAGLYASAKLVPQFRGFGVSIEGGFLHVDVRAVGARWMYKKGKPVLWDEGLIP